MCGLKKSIIAFCIFSSFYHDVSSANILGLLGVTSHSHQLWNEVIVNALADRGHTLTIASVDENNATRPRVNYIHLEGAYETVADYYKDSDANFDMYGPFANLRLLYSFKKLESQGIFQSFGFKDVWSLKEKFDLILIDISSGPWIFRVLQKYPGVPVVGVSAFKMEPAIVEIAGGHSFPGYVPYFLDHRNVPMNFWNRVVNSATYAFAYFYRKFTCEFYSEDLAEQYLPGPKPTLDSLKRRVNLILMNTHPSMDNAQSLPPNVIEIGGLHIKESKKLPEDIGEFIDSSVKGSVLISLGSNTLVETIGQDRIEAFLNVVRSFPQYNFLWKIEKEDIFKEIPKNLMIRKWLPQNDILANPKVDAFFTHAGGLSMQEAVWHGVPVIAMPLFLDQFTNAQNAELKGCGVEVNFEKLTNESLVEAFSKVLNDKSYKRNMRKLHLKFRNRQNKPLDTAIWWIEYLLKDPNPDHLSPASRDISAFVANSIDIYALVLVICVILVIFLWILLKRLVINLSEPEKKEELDEKSVESKKSE